MKFKKFLVVALAVTMIMGSSSMAFAKEGTGTGTGDLDIVQKTDVFDVVVPINAGTQFNYILDPTGVITETKAGKYEGLTFKPNQTVYFRNVGEKEVTGAEADGKYPYHYSGTSNKIEAINKSTGDVTIDVKAKVTDKDEVTMASATTGLADATDAQLYLALKPDTGSAAPLPNDGTEATLTEEIAAVSDAYEVKVNANKEYVKELKDEYKEGGAKADKFNSYGFVLEGQCSGKKAEKAWKEVKQFPKVDIVWSVTGAGEDAAADKAPSIAKTSYTLSSDAAIDINVDLGAGSKAATAVTSVKWKFNGYECLNDPALPITYANGKLTLTETAVKAFRADASALPATLVVTFNDTEPTTVEINLSK